MTPVKMSSNTAAERRRLITSRVAVKIGHTACASTITAECDDDENIQKSKHNKGPFTHAVRGALLRSARRNTRSVLPAQRSSARAAYV